MSVTVRLREDACELAGGGEDGIGNEDVQKLWEPYMLKPLAVAGTHRTLYERCADLQEEIQKKLPGLTTEFNKRVCECMGCCAPKSLDKQCYFPFMQEVR